MKQPGTLFGSSDAVEFAPGAQRVSGCREETDPRLADLVQRFAPVNLDEIGNVALQNRIDTKYVLGTEQLHYALAALSQHYRILDINGVRLSRYQTLYFDTHNFAMYLQHHAGRPNRYKVRSRKYLDTNLVFLEVKLKSKGIRTIKRRIQTPELITRMTSRAATFVREQLPTGRGALHPQLWNTFSRITLVSIHRQERLTLDAGLGFSTSDAALTLPAIVVAEVKQANRARTSDFMQLMREQGIRSNGFSKYCVGLSLLHPGLKHNNFMAQHRLLRKLVQGDPVDSR